MRIGAAVLAAVWGWAAPVASQAHPAALTSAEATVEADGRFRMVIQFDTLAFALNDTSARIGNAPMEELLAGPRDALEARLTEARMRFLRGFRVTTDHGEGRVEASEFPGAAQVLDWKATTTPVLPVTLPVTLRGHLPSAAGTVAFRFPGVLEQVILTVERPGEEPLAEPVEAGMASTALSLKVPNLAPGTPGPEVVAPKPAEGPGRLALIGRYIHLGFRHILPEGTDHILFVLGLYLFSTRLRPLLVQVTAFTVAHSITLGLSLYGVVRLPPTVVEPLIALSIVFVAVENIRTTDLHASRALVVFGFGLMHGLGFATALIDLGLPRRDFLTALVGFNAGVELGQLTVVAIAAVSIGWLGRWRYYRPAVVWPLSGGIAVVAAIWTVQRLAK